MLEFATGFFRGIDEGGLFQPRMAMLRINSVLGFHFLMLGI